MPITAAQARIELAKRELARRQKTVEPAASQSSPMLDMVSQAIGQTPLGMAAQGAGQAASALSTPLLSVGREVGAPISAVTTRPGRALGVAAAEMTNYPRGNTPQDIQNAIKAGQEAYQVGYQPQTVRQQIGSVIGEGGALAGLGMIPGVGPELATAAGISSGIEKTGGVSPGDVLSAGAIGATNIPRIANAMGFVKRAVPAFLKSKKGIPLEVTKMALEDPSIINQKAIPGAIRDKVENVISTFNEAKQKVGDEIGKVYMEQAGLPNPVDEYIANLPEYKSIQNASNTIPTREPAADLNQLQQQYHDVLDGSFFKKKDLGGGISQMDNKESLAKLTELKRGLQAQAEYNPTGTLVGPSKGVQDAAMKKMANHIDEIRGRLPGGEKMALADDAYNEISAIKNRLLSVLKDEGSTQDYLNRIIKGNIDWLTAGRNGQKVEAIKRIEELTGKQVLKPALEQMAIAYINNPDILSLPAFNTSAFFYSMIPTNKILSAASKFERLGKNVMGRRYSVAPTSMGLIPKENQ